MGQFWGAMECCWAVLEDYGTFWGGTGYCGAILKAIGNCKAVSGRYSVL